MAAARDLLENCRLFRGCEKAAGRALAGTEVAAGASAVCEKAAGGPCGAEVGAGASAVCEKASAAAWLRALPRCGPGTGSSAAPQLAARPAAWQVFMDSLLNVMRKQLCLPGQTVMHEGEQSAGLVAR